MRWIVRIGGLVTLMAALMLVSTGCTSVLVSKAEQTARTLLTRTDEATDASTLRREVQLLNLLNGLELSDDQMHVVLENAKEAERIRKELRDEGQESEADIVSVLSQFREALLDGKSVPDALQREWHELHGKGLALMREYKEEMARLASKVQTALKEHQLHALKQFVPCIVPPKGDLRIGQAGNTAAAERALARVREMPQQQFDRHKVQLAERALERWKQHLPKGFGPDERARRVVVSIMEEARALSDVEFEVEKADLAQRLHQEFAPGNASPPVDKLIATHLLDRRIIPLLEEMMR